MLTNPSARSNDTLARYAVYALCTLALWAGVRQLERPATSAQAQDIIILQATPTPALPTPAPDAPAFVLIAPTPAPVAAPEAPTPVQGEEAAPAPLSAPIDNSGGMIADTAPPPAVDTPSDAQIGVNDPNQNGGNIAPEGCPFPIINGRCANGALAKNVPDDQMFGSKSIADPGTAPQHEGKARP